MVEEQERILKRINVPGECNYRVDGLCKHSMGTPYHVGERCNAGWTDFPDWCPLELAPPKNERPTEKYQEGIWNFADGEWCYLGDKDSAKIIQGLRNTIRELMEQLKHLSEEKKQ